METKLIFSDKLFVVFIHHTPTKQENWIFEFSEKILGKTLFVIYVLFVLCFFCFVAQIHQGHVYFLPRSVRFTCHGFRWNWDFSELFLSLEVYQ